jgi:hypothetical protein
VLPNTFELTFDNFWTIRMSCVSSATIIADFVNGCLPTIHSAFECLSNDKPHCSSSYQTRNDLTPADHWPDHVRPSDIIAVRLQGRQARRRVRPDFHRVAKSQPVCPIESPRFHFSNVESFIKRR